jgi:hypothetical protein
VFFDKYLYISFFNSQTMRIKSFIHNSTTMFPLKTYTLAGFEPGSSCS